MELRTLVSDFAEALRRVDAEGPQHTTRKGRTYQPGLGPHPEDVAVKLVLERLRVLYPGVYDHAQLPSQLTAEVRSRPRAATRVARRGQDGPRVRRQQPT